MKKINVNQDACIGCGACVAIDPEHFAFNDEGLSNAISNNNLESNDLKNAIDSCPTSAISMIEASEDSNSNTKDCNCHEEEKCSCHCNDHCEGCE